MAITPRPIITKELIYSHITSLDIFQYYCLNFKKVGEFFSSEFRDDKHASCQIDWIRGDLMYSDFGDIKGIRAIEYVMLKYNLKFYDALEKIYYNLKINERYNSKNLDCFNYNRIDINSNSFFKTHQRIGENKPTTIRIKRRVDANGKYTFRETDLQYWREFYWTEWMLRQSKTWAISHYFINSRKTNYETRTYPVYNERVFSYEYYYHEGAMRRKLYFPDRQDFRWISNVDDTIVQLVDVAPKQGDVLFITSSKKDAGIFWRLNLEKIFPFTIHGVAANTEASCVPAKWFYKMKERWKHIILYYNHDQAGIKNANKYSTIYNIPFIDTGTELAKDPSDFAKMFNLYNFLEVLRRDMKLNN